jgi:hypothetical protein
MPNQKARATGEGGSQQTSYAKKTAGRVPDVSDRSGNKLAAPVLGDRIEYECRGGGEAHQADAAYRIDKYTKRPRWFIGSFSTRCSRGAECLRRICEWLAELGIEITAEQLLNDPRPALLAAGAKGRRQGERPPPPLPGLGFISGWHSRLLEQQNVAALNYLLGRGVSLEVIKRFRIGWDGHRLTFPMRRGLLKTREPRDGANMKCWPGKDRDWPLYPEVPRDVGWVLLVAGELDALAGISAGLPAVSVTLGASAWPDTWTQELKDADVRVLVCFDLNETVLARRRVKELRQAGIRARQLDLRNLGLTEAKGDLSDYLNGGGDPKRIKPPGRRTP